MDPSPTGGALRLTAEDIPANATVALWRGDAEAGRIRVGGGALLASTTLRDGAAPDEETLYWIEEVFPDGVHIAWTGPARVESTDATWLFDRVRLRPNPLRDRVRIEFDLPHRSVAEMRAYDAIGRRIWECITDEMPIGYHPLDWTPSGLSTGIYWLQVTAGAQTRTARIVRLR